MPDNTIIDYMKAYLEGVETIERLHKTIFTKDAALTKALDALDQIENCVPADFGGNNAWKKCALSMKSFAKIQSEEIMKILG